MGGGIALIYKVFRIKISFVDYSNSDLCEW